MNAETIDEYCEILSERSGFYRLLAGFYFKEVTDDLINALTAFPVPDLDRESLLYQGYREMKTYLVRRGPDPRTDLAVDYARVFLSAGTYEGEAANPYESIYTSEEGLIMQDARDEVRLIFIRQGVSVDESLNLPEDHLSFELEFMAIMSEKALALVQEKRFTELAENLRVQSSFIDDHLENWLPDLQQRIEGCAQQRFYPAICMITRGYVGEDKKLLGDMIARIDAV